MHRFPAGNSRSFVAFACGVAKMRILNAFCLPPSGAQKIYNRLTTASPVAFFAFQDLIGDGTRALYSGLTMSTLTFATTTYNRRVASLLGDLGVNSEQQSYQKANVVVRNGTLVITARRQQLDHQRYTSGRINTGVGRFELFVSARLVDLP